jgi:hypothetical protein
LSFSFRGKTVNSQDLLSGFVDRPTLAEQLGCCDRTLKRYESEPDGLPHMILAGRKLYPVAGVQAWLAKRVVRPNPRRKGA